jgi:hypothetical protein
MRFGSSTNHIPILRVLRGPTTHSRECPFGARNSMSPSPTVSMANASMNLLFHTVLFSPFSGASRWCIINLLPLFYSHYDKLVRKRQVGSATVVCGTRVGEV